MTLEESCRRSCDGHDQIEFAFDKKSVQIIDERTLFIVSEASGCERSLEDIDGLRRLPSQFLADGSGVFIPRREISAEGMKEQDSLRLGKRRAGHGKKQRNRTEKYREYHVYAKPIKSRSRKCSLATFGWVALLYSNRWQLGRKSAPDARLRMPAVVALQ